MLLARGSIVPVICGVLALALGARPPAAPAATAKGPLVVGAASHVVIVEYEAWFGPSAVTFAPASLTPRPLLASADMVPYGGGYDSADPAVIRRHVGWLDAIGANAAIVELTNNVSCIFDTGDAALDPAHLNPCGQTTPALNRSFQLDNQQIAKNDAHIYDAWSALGTALKIVPLLACADNGCLTPYSAQAGFGVDPCPAIAGQPTGGAPGNPAVTGPTAFERELGFYADLMARYPALAVVYGGKPLVLIFAPPPIDDDPCMMPALHRLIASRHLDARFTFRMVGGYFDYDQTYWNEPAGFVPHAPVPLAAGNGSLWWSWVDRLNAPFGEYPSYSVSPIFKRVENFTASIATAGQNGWGTWPATCRPAPPRKPLTSCVPGTDYYVDASLRNPHGVPYGTLAAFMRYARDLDPIFLLLHQFNEFALPDEGWDAQTTDDIEPANAGIGYGALAAVRAQIQSFRAAVEPARGKETPRMPR